MEVKAIIKNRRIELGMTMKEVALLVGVSEATISRWESGDIENMRRDKIAALASALKLPPAVIMGWSEPNDTKVVIFSDEHTLLTSYRKLNDFGKKKAREDVEDLTYVPRYAKVMDPTLLQAAHQRTDIEIPEGVDTSDDKFFD